MKYYLSLKILFIIIIIYPVNCYAYMDPATGSIILQAIVGLLAAGLFAIKTYWYKIKKLYLSLVVGSNEIIKSKDESEVETEVETEVESEVAELSDTDRLK